MKLFHSHVSNFIFFFLYFNSIYMFIKYFACISLVNIILKKICQQKDQYLSIYCKQLLLTSNKLSHCSLRDVTAIQLLFNRLTLSSIRLSSVICAFRASAKSLTKQSWGVCCSVSLCVAWKKCYSNYVIHCYFVGSWADQI